MTSMYIEVGSMPNILDLKFSFVETRNSIRCNYLQKMKIFKSSEEWKAMIDFLKEQEVITGLLLFDEIYLN